MPLSPEQQKTRRKEVSAFVTEAFQNKKNIIIGEMDSFKGAFLPLDAAARAFLQSIINVLNDKYRGDFWFTLSLNKIDSIHDIFVRQKFHDENQIHRSEFKDEDERNFDAFLNSRGIKVVGSWSGGENTLDISYQDEARNVALIAWKTEQAAVVGLVGGNRKFSIPKPRGDSNVAKKLIADGCSFIKEGNRVETNIWAEFEFNKEKKEEISNFSLRICPTSKTKFPIHTYTLIEVKLTEPKSVSARIFDHDDQQLGAVMTLKS